MTVLYFDCIGGVAGDMIIGALVDAGAPQEPIERVIRQLGIERVGIGMDRAIRGGISATSVEFRIPDEVSERSYRDIRAIIEAADLPNEVKQRSLRAFEILAIAEAKVHGTQVEEVHFHEVGALDTIADVVGAATAVQHFAPSSIAASSVPLGSGTVETAHGIMPVPAPAVTEILRGVPVRPGGEGEVTTPTGAAILKALCDSFGEPPNMTLLASGYGAGSRQTNTPNVLRVLVGEAIRSERFEHVLIETNIDDMSPEFVPYVIESLMRAGAQDAWVTPIMMKKGRSAVMLSALATVEKRNQVVDVFYRETTTLGLRVRPIEKDELLREWIEVDVEGHSVRVKIGRRGSVDVTVAPEYEDATRAARATGLALKEVYERATTAARVSLKI